MKIAVFGDTHGHLRLMVELCRRWQLQRGEHLDLILQCGDLGFFPDRARVDRATARFARSDPEELGFADYFARSQSVRPDSLLEATLNGPPDDLSTVRCPALWCHGNHEDFWALTETVGSRDLVAVDRFGLLHYLHSGRCVDVACCQGIETVSGFERMTLLSSCHEVRVFPRGADMLIDHTTVSRDMTVRVAALSGAPEPETMPDTDGHAAEPLGWVGRASTNRLIGLDFDLLVAHGAPRGVVEGVGLGSTRLAEVISKVQPTYCFYAHHGRPIPPAMLGRTSAYWLADAVFQRNRVGGGVRFGGLEPGCMGVLEWNGADRHRFEIVDEPWMNEISFGQFAPPAERPD